jgi:hypothetical protein
MTRRPDRSDDSDDAAVDERSLDALVAALASTLRETEELPVAPSASVWLGEAHAVAEDLARGDAVDEVIHERVGHVHRLLTSAGDLDNEAAAARVDDAVALAAEIIDRTGEEDGADG